jgi:signal peptidase I
VRSLRERLRGPWRVAVTEGSMVPAILPGDWLILNPVVSRWPARGSVVVFHEPFGGALAVKRVASLPGHRVPFANGYLTLGAGEAWLIADADEKAAASVGSGPPVDSRRFGPVNEDDLVGMAVFRYWPPRRIGRIRRVVAPAS